ncbi:MAG: type II toxin-antitoxin system VapC family toxin [Syntrophaceae bacterium]|nr:type II toxin-antitoxin system VapC family toxin [Syntrophaceae bacterium]
MKLFIDTNIFLEVLLGQANERDVRSLMEKIVEHQFFISDYSLHSIGLLLFRRKQHEIFRQFLMEMITNAVIIISLSLDDMGSVIEAAKRFNLDFDDAYQYVSAEKYGLILISFDGDFDRTERGRKLPSQIPGS